MVRPWRLSQAWLLQTLASGRTAAVQHNFHTMHAPDSMHQVPRLTAPLRLRTSCLLAVQSLTLSRVLTLLLLQATPAVLAFYQAASAEVKSHGAQQIIIANPGVVPDRQLAQLVSVLHPSPLLRCACWHHLSGLHATAPSSMHN
jgi:hypothetical protein